MKGKAWHLPWGRRSVPHGVLDIVRGCNITCNACYNLHPPRIKTIEEIEQDLDGLMSHRRLSSISMVGGEVLLHPDLCELVRRVKARGLAVEICTNGVLLDPSRLDALREAGVDIIFLHIENGQQRPDLPAQATREHLRALWAEKTALVGRHGLDVGLSMTAYADKLDEVKDIISFTIESPDVNYLLVTLHRDVLGIESITGHLAVGMQGRHGRLPEQRSDTLNNHILQAFLHEEMGLRPFAYLGSNVDADDPRWLSYLVGSVGAAGSAQYYSLKASQFEKLFLFLSRVLGGRYPMYRRQSPVALYVELLFNGLMGGDLRGNLRFLGDGLKAGGRIRTKRLLFQCPAEVDGEGRVIHCLNCPDAVARNGNLIPVCISDKVT